MIYRLRTKIFATFEKYEYYRKIHSHKYMNMIESPIFVIHDSFLMLIPDINTKSGVYSYIILLLGL